LQAQPELGREAGVRYDIENAKPSQYRFGLGSVNDCFMTIASWRRSVHGFHFRGQPDLKSDLSAADQAAHPLRDRLPVAQHDDIQRLKLASALRFDACRWGLP
jgi:hypothetical protein